MIIKNIFEIPLFIRNTISIIVLFLSVLTPIKGQKISFNGQVAGWLTAGKSDNFAIQTGLRYLPQLSFKTRVKDKYSFDGEFSLDSYLNCTYLSDTNNAFASKAGLYRSWLRFSGDRFEIRAGLQKVNFGSATMLRPLMWFDRIDPRDPLKLTKGVYGLQGKYFFRNNANIWLWVLYGNKNTKGWETIPSKPDKPEIGGRLQFPVPRGEFAFSYHTRTAEFPETWQPPITGSRSFPENRIGFDFKLDLGVGLWFEGTVSHQKQNEIPPFQKAMTIGADYTIGIGNGLNITAEHLIFSTSEDVFSHGEGLSFTGISLSIPVSIITRISTIVFLDWKNNECYRFANLSLTYDNLAFNIIGFWNPDNFRIFNYNTGQNMFAGAGGQIMIVYNY
jgi:hypothetical protein